VLGLEPEALALWTMLQRVCAERPGVVSKKSLMFWRRAAERELHVPPDVDVVTAETGEGWLREWVERQKVEQGRSTEGKVEKGGSGKGKDAAL